MSRKIKGQKGKHVDEVRNMGGQAAKELFEPGREGEDSGKKAYFPLFFNLEGKRVLVVGAGRIATRRALALAEFGANVMVVAPKGIRQMDELARTGMVSWERRCFAAEDMNGCWLTVAATDDAAVNQQVVRLCRERQILVNHAGDKNQCDFYFPGTAREGSLVVGVTASGTDHRLASQATRQLGQWIKQFCEKKDRN
ncbi:MAG: bifunctional precorrin-2 dehydrogenase/sirohydrochlorin ferrochelatase [Lachnospiraceae bacterium]|jgi:precorrin-2 dehydrogenase/sirohydrochlorin ferrochelatase|nr:bifunctional precorrin-2 dehydrogenase/sirohydrochlorin ferrochelatase [Lachnospiraceae bacterium]